MSINTARMLNRIFSNTAWKLLLVIGLRKYAVRNARKGLKGPDLVYIRKR